MGKTQTEIDDFSADLKEMSFINSLTGGVHTHPSDFKSDAINRSAQNNRYVGVCETPYIPIILGGVDGNI